MQIISLTTDFGMQDWFVGTMKGVILDIASHAAVADIAHGIPAGDIRAGAFALAASYRFFPEGTVHVAVIDPGVGSARRAIAVQTQNYFFVGPDNGVLSFALAHEKIKAVHALTNSAFFREPVSRTFHGRDVFAPVAAHLSRGVSIHKLGPPLEDFVQLDWPAPHVRRHSIKGEVVYVDRFGNAITNLDAAGLGGLTPPSLEVFARNKRLAAIAEFYQSAPPGRAVAVIGSSGLLEIAVNGGSAAKQLGLHVGSVLTVRPRARAQRPH